MGKFYARIGEELTLYVRQLAWLNTAPTDKSKAIDQVEGPPLTRLQKLKAEDLKPDLPPLPVPHLVEYLLEIGPVVPAGMGAGPIEWRDIAAWSDLTGTALEAWEARLLRRLSADYLAESRLAEKPEAPAPWTEADQTEAQREAVSRKVSNAFRAFILSKKGGEA